MTPKCVRKERRRLHREGFAGRAGAELARASDGHRNHHIRVVDYSFRDGLGGTIKDPYVEVWETHDREKRVRIVRLADLVHLVQNLDTSEQRRIIARKATR